MLLSPEPKYKKMFLEQRFALSKESKIIIHRKCEDTVKEYGSELKEQIKDKTDLDLDLIIGSKEDGCICFRLSSNKVLDEYHLVIKESGISICGGNSNGLKNGVKTLMKIIDKYGDYLPFTTINDFPDEQDTEQSVG